MSKSIINILIVAFVLVAFEACTGAKTENQQADNSGKRIIETGELAAIETSSFTMPRFGRMWFNLKVIGILKHGTSVKAGDSIIRLDPTDIQKLIIDKQTQLETQLAVIEKLKVDQNNNEQELNSQLKSETATFNLRKLELEAAKFETEKNKKVKQMEFNQAKIEFAKVQRQLNASRLIRSTTMKIELLKAKQLKSELQDAKDIIPKLIIHTPISGIFQVGKNRRTGDMIKIGDEVYPGAVIGNVPDLTWMKVNTCIGERDFMKVSIGQQVIVRLDALPRVKFEGKVTYIGKLCHLKGEKSKNKIFDVEIKMLKSDLRLKPGMTVSCEYVL